MADQTVPSSPAELARQFHMNEVREELPHAIERVQSTLVDIAENFAMMEEQTTPISWIVGLGEASGRLRHVRDTLDDLEREA